MQEKRLCFFDKEYMKFNFMDGFKLFCWDSLFEITYFGSVILNNNKKKRLYSIFNEKGNNLEEPSIVAFVL